MFDFFTYGFGSGGSSKNQEDCAEKKTKKKKGKWVRVVDERGQKIVCWKDGVTGVLWVPLEPVPAWHMPQQAFQQVLVLQQGFRPLVLPPQMAAGAVVDGN